jgi:lysophospholipase L1-like esterase
MSFLIAALTDSLGLPRGGAEPTTARQTWPMLLRAAVDDVVHIGIGGATVTQLSGQLPYALSSSPDLVIVQAGIVDCAPRALRLWERTALQQLPGGRRISRVIEKRARLLRRVRNIAFTAPDTFRETCAAMKTRAGASALWWVGIVDAGDEAQVPGIRRRIAAYNDILRTTFADRFIDVSAMPDSGVCADHHHLTSTGHAFVARTLLDRLAMIRAADIV